MVVKMLLQAITAIMYILGYHRFTSLCAKAVCRERDVAQIPFTIAQFLVFEAVATAAYRELSNRWVSLCVYVCVSVSVFLFACALPCVPQHNEILGQGSNSYF
jgi:hypothetical protein